MAPTQTGDGERLKMPPEADFVDTASTERWNQLKELFVAAVDMPAADRQAFVEAACSGDGQLRAELEGLLGSAESDDDFIVLPAADAFGWADDRNEHDLIGRTIGPYRIVGLAGRGGLSHVYRAVRDGAGYEQQVAIKLLRSGFSGAALLRRFGAERRMLAALSHPNIALFIDGDATEDGTPYLVMEFVEGRPLDEYCDANRLSLEARIDLIRVLCGAVQYVHQHLMVHGDLKGGNVLVTPEGVVKLLDFGIAKLLTPETVAGPATQPATLMMLTPDYASPEQLRGESITTASDVYSLGALLYRVLTGATPYGTDHTTPSVITERMAAGGPMPPDVAAARTGGANAAFARALRGDLGTIILRALKVDPRERYASAQQLGDDLQRWVRGLPVEARPDTTGYRLRKWTQRHRAAAALSALAAVALVGGIAATSWQAHLAGIERTRAEQNFARAERNFTAVRELSSVFLQDVYQAMAKISGSTEARKLLVSNTLKYLQALEKDAGDSPELQRDLGTAYERLADVQGAMLQPSLGDRAAAIASYRRSLAIRKQLAVIHPSLLHRGEHLRAQVLLTQVLLNSDQTAEAKTLGPETVRLANEIDADPETGLTERRYVAGAFMTHGKTEWTNGDLDAGIKSLLHAREVYRRIAAEYPDDRRAQRDLAVVAGRLGEAYSNDAEHFEESIHYYQETVTKLEPLAEEDPDDFRLERMIVLAREMVGSLNNRLRRPRDALDAVEPTLPFYRRMLAEDAEDHLAPFLLATALNVVGESRLQLRESKAAQRTFAEAVSLADPERTAAQPDLMLVSGAAYAGLARAHAAMPGGNPDPAQNASRQDAERAGRRALEILEPLATKPEVGKDAQYEIDALRTALGLKE